MKPQLKIYCASPITGKTWKKVNQYYKNITERLGNMDYIVFNPMVSKGEGCGFAEDNSNNVIGPGNYKTTNPSLSNKAIKKRDYWMVQQADVVLIDFSDAKAISIGCVSELAIADFSGKHTVVVMGRNNLHEHAFILEESDVVFEHIEYALAYLRKLINQKI